MEAKVNLREISKKELLIPGSKKGASKEDLKLSATLRIADAVEKIAENYSDLIDSRNQLKARNAVLEKEINASNKRAKRYETLYNNLKTTTDV